MMEPGGTTQPYPDTHLVPYRTVRLILRTGMILTYRRDL